MKQVNSGGEREKKLKGERVSEVQATALNYLILCQYTMNRHNLIATSFLKTKLLYILIIFQHLRQKFVRNEFEC